MGLSDSLDQSSSRESFNAAIPQASGGAAVPEELKRVVRDVVFQPQNRSDIDDLHVGPQIIDHHGGRRRGCGGGGRGFEGAFQLGEVAGEGEGGAEEERVGLQGPGGEGGDEAGGQEGVFVVGVVGLLGVGEGGEVGGDEAERVVLGTEVEEVVELRLALFHHTAARRALRYRTTGVGCRRAPCLAGGAVGAPHFCGVCKLSVLSPPPNSSKTTLAKGEVRAFSGELKVCEYWLLTCYRAMIFLAPLLKFSFK